MGVIMAIGKSASLLPNKPARASDSPFLLAGTSAIGAKMTDRGLEQGCTCPAQTATQATTLRRRGPRECAWPETGCLCIWHP